MRRPTPTQTLLAAAAAAIVVVAAFPQSSFGQGPLTRQEMKCKYQTVGALLRYVGRMMRVRIACAEQQAQGGLQEGVNCLAHPEPRGIGTASSTIDRRINKVLTKASKRRTRLSRQCDVPSVRVEEIGIDRVCGATTSGWLDLLSCVENVADDVVSAFGPLYYPAAGDRGLTTLEERQCRGAIAAKLRNVFLGRVRRISDCFRREDQGKGDFDCMAISAWPGRVDTTLDPKTDRRLLAQLMAVRDAVYGACDMDLAAAGFTLEPAIVDHTATTAGGEDLSAEDLFHLLNDVIVTESTRVLARLFPGESYCGDGIVDSNEQCDTCDLNAVGCDLSSCDGCNRDCTSSGCGDGAACGPSEICDDGNVANEDGCDSMCQPEFCGDGVIQIALGEVCDDGNSADCDGCDSNCTPSFLCNNAIACTDFGEECDNGLGVCIGGFNRFGPCVSDDDCGGTCVGGDVPDERCLTNTDCGPGICETAGNCGGNCVGGVDDGLPCTSDDECSGACEAIAGHGSPCSSGQDCEPGLTCTGGGSCVLPSFNEPCATDDDCGLGGVCAPSGGCDFGNSSTAPDACRDNCVAPMCGDGVTDPNSDTNGLGGEGCDDGNLVSGDGCDENCTATGCNNAIVTEGEECDLGLGACMGGFDAGAVCLEDEACRGACSNDPSIICTFENAILACSGHPCVVSGGCMGGNADGVDCRPDCTVPRCGDGVIDAGEECDDGEDGVCNGGPDDGATCAVEMDCRGLCITGFLTNFPCFNNAECEIAFGSGTCKPYFCEGVNSDTIPNACRIDCTLPSCGDGVRDSGEQCDGADAVLCPGLCAADCSCSGGPLPTTTTLLVTTTTLSSPTTTMMIGGTTTTLATVSTTLATTTTTLATTTTTLF